MKNAFYDRVIREQIVDTKQYRYIAKDCYNADEQWVEIRRLPIKDLDTTNAIDSWETVKSMHLLQSPSIDYLQDYKG